MAADSERGALQIPVAGVTLIAVLLLIAVSSILMGQAMETWDSQIRHEDEETLIARGEEYKTAIELFYRMNGRLPVRPEELCPKEKADVRYIRRCWKDPLTGKEFRLLGPGEPGKRKAANQKKKQDQERDAADLDGGFGQRDRGSRDDGGGLSPGRPSFESGPALSQVEWGLPGQESKEQLKGDKPFLGVVSSAADELVAFKDYLGSFTYSEWEFVAVTQGIQPPARAGGGGGAPPGTFPTPFVNPAGVPTPTPFGGPGMFPKGFPGATPRPFPTPRPFGTPRR